jgi:transposase, IS5 family
MSRRRIGQETIGFGDGQGRRQSSLDELVKLIDWTRVETQLVDISSSAKGEPAWPPLALFKALLLSIWYDLSDVKLAEALDDRTSFRRFCGFSGNEATPERTAFVRFRKALTVCALDKSLFEEITHQLKPRAIKVKAGTLVDATIIVSASKEDDEGHWVKHKVGLAKSCWRVWPCQQATDHFCGGSSGMSARAASSLQCGLQESTTGAGARALPGQ